MIKNEIKQIREKSFIIKIYNLICLYQNLVLDFVNSALEIIQMSPEQRNSIRDAARYSVNRFSEKNFEKRWNSAIEKLLPAYD